MLKRTIASSLPSILGLMLALPAAAQTASPTLDAVKKRGEVVCGVSGLSQGFSFVTPNKEWSGIDVDLCRAVAAATLGDAKKVKFTQVTPQNRFEQLRSGAIDLLAANVTFTLQREAGLGIQPTAINYYDGQAFVVARKSGVVALSGLAGKTICVARNSTHLGTLTDWFQSRGLTFTPVAADDKNAVYEAFFSDKCVGVTEDATALAAAIVSRGRASDYMRLPDVISKEPLGPYVRRGDDAWQSIVRWTQYAMIEAEELAIFGVNVDDQLKSADPDIRRFLGITPGNGKALGLDEKWAYNIVKQVGNYAESYDRNVGQNSPLQFARGINGLWKHPGGMMYAPPMR